MKNFIYFVFIVTIILNISCQQKENNSPPNSDEIISSNKKEENVNIPINSDLNKLNIYQNIDLPPLSSFRLIGKTSIKVKEINVERLDYQPIKSVIINTRGNIFKGINSKTLENVLSWRVRSMKIFEFNGRAFSYFIRADLVNIDEKGNIEAMAATTAFLFTDEDGDRRIEKFSIPPLFPEIPSIPKWIELEKNKS